MEDKVVHNIQNINKECTEEQKMSKMRKEGYSCNLGTGEFFNPCMNREINCLQCHYFIKR